MEEKWEKDGDILRKAIVGQFFWGLGPGHPLPPLRKSDVLRNRPKLFGATSCPTQSYPILVDLGLLGPKMSQNYLLKKKTNPYRFLLNGWCSENQTSDIHQNRGNGVQPRGSSEDQQKSQSGFGDFYSHIHRSGPWGSSQKIWKFPTKPMVSRGPSPTCPCVRQVQRVILSALKTLGAGSCPNCWEGIRYLNDLV